MQFKKNKFGKKGQNPLSRSQSSEEQRRSRQKQKKTQHNIKDKKIKNQIQSKRNQNNLKRRKVNSYPLANMILEHKKTNKRLDEQEVSRAAIKFKQNFTQEIKPITMSAFLCNEDLQMKLVNTHDVQKTKNGYICTLQGCYLSFKQVEELQAHLEEHKINLLNNIQ